MWTDGTVPGNFKRIDTKLGDTLGITVIEELMEECHKTIVPPWALLLDRERS